MPYYGRIVCDRAGRIVYDREDCNNRNGIDAIVLIMRLSTLGINKNFLYNVGSHKFERLGGTK